MDTINNPIKVEPNGNINDSTIQGKRTVTVPWYPECGRTTNEMINVTLSPDEDVEWTWNYGPDGQRQVIGYTIIKKAHLFICRYKEILNKTSKKEWEHGKDDIEREMVYAPKSKL